ncbi:MAG: thiamine phosphate synthase [Acidobacteriia bacterium]|nr:thiamine phosphate synthase [Terriglobia bacterium]
MPVSFRLCYITDGNALQPRPLLPLIEEAVQAGIDLIQIREQGLPTRELLQLVENAVAAAKGSGTCIVVNDRLDVALAAGADGVHLGTQSIPARAVRAKVSQEFVVGVSCHSRQEALAAEDARADYVLLGPIFETPSKIAYGPPLGLGLLRETAAAAGIPVLALGGISVERVRVCLEAGAAGVAGIRIFQDPPSLLARVRELRAQFP